MNIIATPNLIVNLLTGKVNDEVRRTVRSIESEYFKLEVPAVFLIESFRMLEREGYKRSSVVKACLDFVETEGVQVEEREIFLHIFNEFLNEEGDILGDIFSFYIDKKVEKVMEENIENRHFSDFVTPPESLMRSRHHSSLLAKMKNY